MSSPSPPGVGRLRLSTPVHSPLIDLHLPPHTGTLSSFTQIENRRIQRADAQSRYENDRRVLMSSLQAAREQANAHAAAAAAQQASAHQHQTNHSTTQNESHANYLGRVLPPHTYVKSFTPFVSVRFFRYMCVKNSRWQLDVERDEKGACHILVSMNDPYPTPATACTTFHSQDAHITQFIQIGKSHSTPLSLNSPVLSILNLSSNELSHLKSGHVIYFLRVECSGSYRIRAGGRMPRRVESMSDVSPSQPLLRSAALTHRRNKHKTKPQNNLTLPLISQLTSPRAVESTESSSESQPLLPSSRSAAASPSPPPSLSTAPLLTAGLSQSVRHTLLARLHTLMNDEVERQMFQENIEEIKKAKRCREREEIRLHRNCISFNKQCADDPALLDACHAAWSRAHTARVNTVLANAKLKEQERRNKEQLLHQSREEKRYEVERMKQKKLEEMKQAQSQHVTQQLLTNPYELQKKLLQQFHENELRHVEEHTARRNLRLQHRRLKSLQLLHSPSHASAQSDINSPHAMPPHTHHTSGQQQTINTTNIQLSSVPSQHGIPSTTTTNTEIVYPYRLETQAQVVERLRQQLKEGLADPEDACLVRAMKLHDELRAQALLQQRLREMEKDNELRARLSRQHSRSHSRTRSLSVSGTHSRSSSVSSSANHSRSNSVIDLGQALDATLNNKHSAYSNEHVNSRNASRTINRQ